jgi:cysteine synthase/rhodanese-related sulfurtransferase
MADHNLKVYDDMLELSCNENNPTPLVKLNKLNPFKNLKIYSKLEWYNPFGSMKDRPALNMIENAGNIPSKKLVEPTSGNTGLGLAAVSNLKGLTLKATVSTEIPEEKKVVLRFLGADVSEVPDTLCPDPDSPEGAIGLAKVFSKNKEYHMLNQYENQHNLEAHYKTTGPEIWKQTEGKVTQVVCGLGTCGSIGGIGKYLKEKNPNIKVIAIHPKENHNIPGVRSLKQLKVTKLFTPNLYDEIVEVSNNDSYTMAKRLNQEESIIAGPSSGMVLAGALKILKDDVGIAVLIFPDNIFKYASYIKDNKGDTMEKTIELEDAKEIVRDVVVIDVRNKEKFAEYHLPGAVNIPFEELSTCNLPKETRILTVCNHGNASLRAVEVLNSAGYTNVKSINGGTEGWMEKGYSVET